MTNKRTGIYKKMSIKRKMLSLRGRKAARVEGRLVMGGPAALTRSFKTEVKLSDGSQVKLSGLVFDEADPLYI